MSSKKTPSARDLINAKLKQKSATRLVNSPYAKYNSRDQLMCVVCGCRVTSAIVWQAHVTKKSHLENLENLKKRQYLLNNPVSVVKRKSTFTSVDSPPLKKAATVAEFKPKSILKGIKSYESSSSEDEDISEKNPTTEGHDGELLSQEPSSKDEMKSEDMETDASEAVDEPVIAEDENDPSVFYKTEKDKKKPVTAAKPNTTEKLPEGFFDDPVADAKARKVEYVNKDEAEWNAFMQEVSVAETTSRQIIAEDTEESAKRNQILQAEEQMMLYQRVLRFDQAKQDTHQLKEEISETPIKEENDDDSDLDDDDTSMNIINWRNKSSLM